MTLSRISTPSGISRFLFAGAGSFLTFVGNELGDEAPILWYQTRIAGVPVQYLILAVLVALSLPYVTRSSPMAVIPRLKASKIWVWVVLGYVAITIALAMALARGTEEPFVDWRNWAVIALVSVLVAKWINDRPWKRYALTDLAIGWGAIATIHFFSWIRGGGVELFDVRIPLLDGYDLMLAGTTTIIAVDAWIRRSPSQSKAYRVCLQLAGLSSAAVVLLSFRRAIWLFLLTGVGVVVIQAIAKKRVAPVQLAQLAMGLVLAIALTGLAIGWDAMAQRIASINPFETRDNPYAATNQDHRNDLIDAWEVVNDEPVFGLGIGTTYKTNLIANWKTESFDVHNAFLHAWLKFGLLGLLAYAGLHISLIRACLQGTNETLYGVVAAGAAVAGEQVVGLVQPWPYSSFQFSLARALLIGFLIASLSIGGPRHPHPKARARRISRA